MATDYIDVFAPGKNCAKKCHGKLLLDQKQQRDNSHIGLIGSNPIFLGLESDICHGLFRENVYFSQLTTLFDLTKN